MQTEYYYHSPFIQDIIVTKAFKYDPITKTEKLHKAKISYVKYPRITIMGRLDVERSLFLITYARCSAQDNFERATGRLICEDKMENPEKEPVLLFQVPLEHLKQPGKYFVQTAKSVALKHL